jgi:monoamine oxidase
MTYDLVVIGAGLAGLSAARDLVHGGADVLVLEARNRVGGRVEQVALDDGRIVQLGGEVIGDSHTAYQGLVAELGLTLIPSYVAEPGELTYVLHEGAFVGDTPTWFSTTDHRSMEQVEREFAALAATVDPDDPWSHPEAVALDDMSVTGWLGAIGPPPTCDARWRQVNWVCPRARSSARRCSRCCASAPAPRARACTPTTSGRTSA